MVKKTKKSTLAGLVLARSRYTSPPVTLHAGDFLFFVPEVLLQTLSDLPRSESDNKTIELPDLDAETGHTIAHFLHTGEYQSLPADPDHVDEEAPSKAQDDFKKAIAAFAAAKKYGLTALQDLAKTEAIHSANEISVVQAAHAIGKDTLTALQEDAGWLQDLVLHKAEHNFEENNAIFSSPTFFSGIESLELAKLLGQRVAKLYHDYFLYLCKLVDAPCGAPFVAADHGVEEIVEHAVQVAVEEIGPANSACEVAEESLPESQAIAAPLEDVEQEVFAIQEYDASDAATELRAEPERVAEENYVVVERPAVSEEGESYAPSPVTAAVPNLTTASGKKALMDLYRTRTGPFEGLTKKESMLLKRKLRADAAARKVGAEAALQQAPAEEAPPEQVAQEDGAADSAPVAAVSDVVLPNPFAGLSKVQRKKLEKKMKDEAAAKEAAEKEAEDQAIIVPCQEPEIEQDPFAGLSKKEKKRLMKGMQEEAAAKEAEEQATIAQCQDAEVVTGSDWIEPQPNSAVDMDASEDENCPFRFEHLAQNDGWRDCKPCEVYMRKFAVKLHSAGLPDINGLVAK